MYQRHTTKIAFMTAFIFAACSDATAPESDPLIDADVALMAADAAIDDLRSMSNLFGGLVGAPAPMSADTLTRTRVITFYDAEGNVQDAHDPVTTASINVVVDVSGNVVRDNWTATIERHRDMTASGLEGDETTRIWNGSGNGNVQGTHTDSSGTRSYNMSGTSLIVDVVRGLPREENPYPLSGTINRDITVTVIGGPDGDVTRQRTVSITFNGTQFASLTVNGETFEVDLAARDGRHPIRGRGQ